MKDRILATLKAKFSGVSADILDRIAVMLAKTVTTEEQVATAVEGVTEELINYKTHPLFVGIVSGAFVLPRLANSLSFSFPLKANTQTRKPAMASRMIPITGR